MLDEYKKNRLYDAYRDNDVGIKVDKLINDNNRQPEVKEKQSPSIFSMQGLIKIDNKIKEQQDQAKEKKRESISR